jgi:hypothetical protein
MRGGRLVTPAEAEDLPSLSLVDASLRCPRRTLAGLSTTQQFDSDDHSDGDAEHAVHGIV